MTKTKFNPRPRVVASGLAIAFGVALTASSAVLAQGHPPAPPQGIPAPKILVIDRQALLRASNVGLDIQRQVQVLTKGAEAELKGENDSLRREGQALQQQVAILAPDVKNQKIRAFEAKQASFQQRVQSRQNQIRYGVALAEQQVEKVAGPVVQQLMQERGANLLIDRQAIVIGAPGLDVTAVAIQRMNQKLSTVKVELVSPPPELLKRMQPQQQ